MKVSGVNAVLALWRARPADLVRLYVREDRTRELGAALHDCAARKIAYHMVTDEDLDKLSESTHHEGVVALCRLPPLVGDAALLERLDARDRRREVLLWLDGVGNPHNVGALLRTAAHFGVAAVLGVEGEMPGISQALLRVSEGGAEQVPISRLADPGGTLDALRERGYVLFGTDSRAGNSLYGGRLPDRLIIALGNEGQGLSSRLARRCDRVLHVPGSGLVESVNVGVAGALMLGEWWRQGA
jgi:TrmH RNA methyltransferase